jgi:Skp family chaperone for outer membrane proteins
MTWLAAVVVLGSVAYVGSSLGAKPAPEKAAGPARVALVNLRLVIKQYTRYQEFITTMKKEEQRYLDQLTKKQKEIEKLAKSIEDATDDTRKEMEKKVKLLQREMEDIKEQAKAEVTEKSNNEMVAVYKDVREAATRYAKTNNIDLVLHFEGPAEKNEVDTPVLITRNMNAGGCVPMYWNPDLDVSQAVLDALNAKHKREN